MKHRRSILLSSVALLIVALAAAPAGRQAAVPGEEFLGTWNGSFDGSGTGTFAITLAKDAQGAIAANIAVMAAEGSYTANFKTLQFDGNRMKGAYAVPPEELVQVSVAGTFEPMTASGTWSARDTVGGNEVGGGTWTLKKTP